MVVEVFEVQDSPSIFIFFSLMNISETNSSDQRSGTFSIAQGSVLLFEFPLTLHLVPLFKRFGVFLERNLFCVWYKNYV